MRLEADAAHGFHAADGGGVDGAVDAVGFFAQGLSFLAFDGDPVAAQGIFGVVGGEDVALPL